MKKLYVKYWMQWIIQDWIWVLGWGAVEWYLILFLHNKSILHETLLFTCQMLLWKVFAWTRHVWVWELDYRASRVLKNWCFWTLVLEKTLESPLDCKEIQPVHPKGDQAWMFIGRTDVDAETPIFGPLMRRADSIEKILMLGKIEGRRRRGQQRMRWLDGITDSMDMGLGRLQSWWWIGRTSVLWFMESQRVRHDWATVMNWFFGHAAQHARS